MLRCFLEVTLHTFIERAPVADVHFSETSLTMEAGSMKSTGFKTPTRKTTWRSSMRSLQSNPRYKKIDLSTEGVGFIGYGFAWGHLERAISTSRSTMMSYGSLMTPSTHRYAKDREPELFSNLSQYHQFAINRLSAISHGRYASIFPRI